MSNEVILVVLLVAFIHALWNAMLRGTTDRFRARTLMVVTSSLAALSLLAFLPAPAAGAWPYMAVSIGFHLGYNLLLVRMYREGDLSHTYLICRAIQPLLVSVGSIFIAAEKLSVPMLVGVVLISSGIFILATGGHMKFPALRIAVINGAWISGSTIVDGLGARHSGNTLSYATWIVVLNGIPLLIAYLVIRRDFSIWRLKSADWVGGVGGGLISTAGYAMFIWALAHGAMGAASALREMSILFALFLGWFLLRERLSLRKLGAAVTMVTGVFLIYCGQ